MAAYVVKTFRRFNGAAIDVVVSDKAFIVMVGRVSAGADHITKPIRPVAHLNLKI